MPPVARPSCPSRNWRHINRESPRPGSRWLVRRLPHIFCVKYTDRGADIVARLHTFEDDGHSIKLARAAVICRNICKKYEDEGKDWLKVKGDDMWTKVCHLIVDSVEAPGDRWLRSCGFDEAWKVCSMTRLEKEA